MRGQNWSSRKPGRSLFLKMTSRPMFGVDIYLIEHNKTPTPSTIVEFDEPAELYKWFQEKPTLESKIVIRILCARIETPSSSFTVPLPSDVIGHAIWKPEVYHGLTNNPAGGSAGLVDEPWRFIMQTPLDGGPFVSLAMSRHYHVMKGIFFYDDDKFNPSEMSGGEASLSASRGSGIDLTAIPHKVLQTHSFHISHLLAGLISRVKEVEEALASADRTPPDLSSVTRVLHEVNTRLVFVERRSRFEQGLCDSIEQIIKSSRWATAGTWPALAPQQTAVSSRSFDFESLPRRIQNARNTINDLIQQRNANINVELTQASFRIAAATLSDARSMKTIAILTMFLLPATAVASLFSMNLFDWSAEKGSDIGSKWLWIYFVVTIPLTAMIIMAWWIWSRRAARVGDLSVPSSNLDAGSSDRDDMDTPRGGVEDIEMLGTHAK